MSTAGRHSTASLGAGVLHDGSNELGTRQHETRIASLLDEAAISGPSDAIVSEVVTCLRRRDYCLSDLLNDVAAAKRRSGLGEPPQLDVLVQLCADRTAVVHEAAIENTRHGFCELDEAGVVIYANPALLRLVPDCEGRPLVTFLSGCSGGLEAQMAGPEPRAHRLELSVKGASRPVLVELGPTGVARGAAYCIITDLTPEEEAQRRIDDRAEFGILRLDSESRITYANQAACRLLGTSPEDVVGLTPLKFVRNPEDQQRVAAHIALRHEGVSSEYDLEITPLHEPGPVHIRVRSMPQTDADGQFEGTFVTLSRIDAERAAKKIQEALAEACDPDTFFSAVVEHLRSVVPFKYAALSIYAQGGAFSRLIRSVPPMKTNQRWVPLPTSVRGLVDLDWTFGADISEFLKVDADRHELHDNQGVQELLHSGMKSWISLLIRTCDCHAVLTLMHDQRDQYREETAEMLQRAGAADAVRGAIRLDSEKESSFQLALIKRMAQTQGDRDLAKLVVEQLAVFYGWQNVAIFKINANQGQFELLTQAAAELDGYRLPEGYSQGLDEGFLGKTLKEGRIILVGDSNDPGTAAHFVRGSDQTRSEMCVPIRVEGKIVWILNIEDRRPHAFKEPDQTAVERLMGELEPTLEKALGAALLDQVLDDTPDAIVITDFQGEILKCNRAAVQLLGSRVEGRKLEQFFERGSKGEEVAKRTRSERSVPIEAVLICPNGTRTQVLMRSRIPRDEYERRVVILQDRQKLDWQAQTRRLAEVTSETRVPLSLVSTFVRQIKRMTSESAPNLSKLADHAIEQLGRVELSYDRVVASAAGPRRRGKVDVPAFISRLIGGFPPEQRELLQIDPPSSPVPLVRTDSGALREAVEAMLAYLLRVGDEGVAISGRIRSVSGRVEIRLFKPHLPRLEEGKGAPGEKPAAANEARARGALDEPRLYHFAAMNGGDFTRRRGAHGETLRLSLKQWRPRDV